MIRFIFGLIIGSFLNVVSLRYDPEKFLLGYHVIGGRSHCPHCQKTLHWFELVPLISFIFQGGKCRNCKIPLSLQYPIVELITGFIFFFIPFGLHSFSYQLPATSYYLLCILWVLAFTLFLLMTLIDLRLKLIPDEIIITLLIIGIAITAITTPIFSLTSGSFLGPYGALLGVRGSIVLNHLFAALVLSFIFFIISLSTNWRGMGLGDVKLIFALGIIFGWPDILLLAAIAFILGSLVGVYVLVTRRATRKSALPFGPFLALASLIVFFWGENLVRAYFSLFRL